MLQRLLNSRVILIVGAVVIIIGSLLPWAQFNSDFEDVWVSGVDGQRHGIITLILGVAVIVAAVLLNVQRRWAGWIAAALGAIAGVIAIINFSDPDAAAGSGWDSGLIDPAIGVIVVIVGAVICIIGGLLPLRTDAKS
jgi:hypothetical protein